MKLYEIADQYRIWLEKLKDDIEDDFKVDINESLEILRGGLEDKAINIASLIQNVEAEIKAMKEYEDKMYLRRNRLEKLTEKLKDYILTNMLKTEITSIKSPEFEIKLGNCPPSLSIEDHSLIPEEYKLVRTETIIDNSRIKNSLKEGLFIPGSSLKIKKRLIIK